jgi:cytoskeletal protein RodZ
MTNEELFFDALKAHRKSNNIEISEICDFTKINHRYIDAIENGDFTVLPVVYMRLFLRAYSDFIGADSFKALEDYELYTTGKVQKKVVVEPQQETESHSPIKTIESTISTGQIPSMKIATGASILVGLFLVLYWAGQVTNQQNSVVENKPDSVNLIKHDEIAPLDPKVNPGDESEKVEEVKKKLLSN